MADQVLKDLKSCQYQIKMHFIILMITVKELTQQNSVLFMRCMHYKTYIYPVEMCELER